MVIANEIHFVHCVDALHSAQTFGFVQHRVVPEKEAELKRFCS
jgi:hypothetical protein